MQSFQLPCKNLNKLYFMLWHGYNAKQFTFGFYKFTGPTQCIISEASVATQAFKRCNVKLERDFSSKVIYHLRKELTKAPLNKSLFLFEFLFHLLKKNKMVESNIYYYETTAKIIVMFERNVQFSSKVVICIFESPEETTAQPIRMFPTCQN